MIIIFYLYFSFLFYNIITTYPINDGSPHFSNDAYAYAKRMTEVHCKAYNDNYGTDFSCIIPTNIYGPMITFL